MNPESPASIIVSQEAYIDPDTEHTRIFQVPSTAQDAGFKHAHDAQAARRVVEGSIALKTIIADAIEEATDPEDVSCLEGVREAIEERDVEKAFNLLDAVESIPGGTKGQLRGQLMQWAGDLPRAAN
jgi:hypothetical protein